MGCRSRVLLLTGERQVGKTTALLGAVSHMRQAGLSVSGLLTRRMGPQDLEVHELHTGASYRLTDASSSLRPKPHSRFGIDPVALERSVRALRGSFPTQVFVVDELGPLEFKRRQGWIEAIELLATRAYALAVLVVRPSLLGQAILELPAERVTVMPVSIHTRDRVPEMVADFATEAAAWWSAESVEGGG